ncbi:MAG: hypothetical protein J2P18_00340 [Nocardia sp.]|nr:hypothetical protein [Nocardia sp.]
MSGDRPEDRTEPSLGVSGVESVVSAAGFEDSIEAGWLRPRERQWGRPRVSTILLLLVWIGVLLLYLEVRPGG